MLAPLNLNTSNITGAYNPRMMYEKEMAGILDRPTISSARNLLDEVMREMGIGTIVDLRV